MSAGHLEQARAAFLQGLHTLEAGDWLPAAVTHRDGIATPPQQYVRQLFDDYADEFDAHPVKQLRYPGHQLWIARLPPEAAPRFPRVPEPGCGTGPCGAHVRSRAGHLSGVDTSPAMVDKARQRSVYDTLQVADSSAR